MLSCRKSVIDVEQTDRMISSEGAIFNVRYIGCVGLRISMKALDASLRSRLARECIRQVCEKVDQTSLIQERRDSKVYRYIQNTLKVVYSGSHAALNVSRTKLSLKTFKTNEEIAKHDLSRISFASCGTDSNISDFVTYIAKNETGWRACYVLECRGDGQAQRLIATIERAFDFRLKELLQESHHTAKTNTEKEYYNDLPGKLPPDGDVLKQNHQNMIKNARGRFGSNLIDLNSPPPYDSYAIEQQLDISITSSPRDAFDMVPKAEAQRSKLIAEKWFHCGITRPMAENLLKIDGDFLVRESQGRPGQYILSGFEGSTVKHFLLVDRNGIVRTKDRIFDSISHLINYHRVNRMSIISVQGTLMLRNPIVYRA